MGYQNCQTSELHALYQQWLPADCIELTVTSMFIVHGLLYLDISHVIVQVDSCSKSTYLLVHSGNIIYLAVHCRIYSLLNKRQMPSEQI